MKEVWAQKVLLFNNAGHVLLLNYTLNENESKKFYNFHFGRASFKKGNPGTVDGGNFCYVKTKLLILWIWKVNLIQVLVWDDGWFDPRAPSFRRGVAEPSNVGTSFRSIQW